MTHPLHHLAGAALLVAWTVVTSQLTGDVVSGRLAIVEPSAARISLLATGEVKLREIAVAPDAEIRQGDRSLSLSELVIEIGRRVTVRFRTDGDRTVATNITVEPE